jgi:hypothetical protein
LTVTRLVDHAPRWESAQLPVNASGDTRPGFVCTHELENGSGQCGGNVFDPDDAIGDHCCALTSEQVEARLTEIAALPAKEA